jgi:hypothetical protein
MGRVSTFQSAARHVTLPPIAGAIGSGCPPSARPTPRFTFNSSGLEISASTLLHHAPLSG